MSVLDPKLDVIDWSAYHREILALTQAGINAFVSKAPGTKIFQVGIWTDLEARVSAINFETTAHAQSYAQEYAQRLKDEKLYAKADEVLQVGRSANPANFIYRDIAECYHPELEPLRKFLGSRAKFTQADTYLSGRLIRVRQTIVQSSLLRDVPHEDMIWFGVSSQESWYDHEEAFRL